MSLFPRFALVQSELCCFPGSTQHTHGRASQLEEEGESSGPPGRSWSFQIFALPEKRLTYFRKRVFSPTAESFGVSAQIGSGVVRGGPEVYKVPRGSYEGSTGVPQEFRAGFHEVGFGGPETRFHRGPQGSTRLLPCS